MSLSLRFALRAAIGLPLAATAIFAPAGTLEFWQGWATLGVFALCPIFMLSYFFRHDRQLLERRFQRKEQRAKQRLWAMLWLPLWVGLFLISSFDRRFSWSRTLFGGVPPWVSVLALGVMLVAWLLIFLVFRANTFAAAVIQVEASQKVVSSGPYRFIRHPMYSALGLLSFAVPLALGSYVAVPLAPPLVSLLVFRLLDEERLLRVDLDGYSEYCRRTRCRLVPLVW